MLPPAASTTRHYYSWYGVVPGDQLAIEPVLPPVPPMGRDAPVVVARDGDDVTHYAVTGVLDSPSLPNVRVTYISGNDAAGYPAVKQDPLVFDLYDYAQVVPAAPGVYRLAGG